MPLIFITATKPGLQGLFTRLDTQVRSQLPVKENRRPWFMQAELTVSR